MDASIRESNALAAAAEAEPKGINNDGFVTLQVMEAAQRQELAECFEQVFLYRV